MAQPVTFDKQSLSHALFSNTGDKPQSLASPILMKFWKLENKEIEFYVERPRDYQVIVRTEKGVYVLSKDQIRGLPKNISENLERLKSFLSKTHVTLNPSSDDSYSLEILQNGEGGIEPVTIALIGLGVAGGVAIIIAIINAVSKYKAAKINKEIEEVKRDSEKHKSDIDKEIKVKEKEIAEIQANSANYQSREATNRARFRTLGTQHLTESQTNEILQQARSP